MERRLFLKMGSVAGLLLSSMVTFLTGCNANIWMELQLWIPAGIDAFNSIIALLDPPLALAVATITALVKAGFSDVAAAVNEYESAPAADKAGFAGKVKLALQALMDNFQNFLTQVGTADPAAKVVLSLVTVIVKVIAGFIGKVVPSAAVAIPRTLKLAAHTSTVTPVLMDKKQFTAAFNAECVKAGKPEAQIPRAISQ